MANGVKDCFEKMAHLSQNQKGVAGQIITNCDSKALGLSLYNYHKVHVETLSD